MGRPSMPRLRPGPRATTTSVRGIANFWQIKTMFLVINIEDSVFFLENLINKK